MKDFESIYTYYIIQISTCYDAIPFGSAKFIFSCSMFDKFPFFLVGKFTTKNINTMRCNTETVFVNLNNTAVCQ